MARYGKWAAALGTAAAIFASSVAAQEAVSLRLNWYLGGLHVPFYYGKDLGFYKAEGIDLTINEGRGSGNTVQVVAAGSDTFGMADSGSLALAARFCRSPSRPPASIKTPARSSFTVRQTPRAASSRSRSPRTADAAATVGCARCRRVRSIRSRTSCATP